MDTVKEKLEGIRKNNYTLDFGTIFNATIEYYKKIALYSGLILLVFTFVFIVIIYFGLIATYGVETIQAVFKPENLNLRNLSPDVALKLSVFGTLFPALISPITAGLIKMVYCADKDEEFHVSSIFEFYNFSFFINLFTATLIIALLNQGITMLFESLVQNEIGMLLSLTLSILTILTIPFIIFGKLNAFEAIKASFTVVSKQLITISLLVIVCSITSILGIFGLIIGVFFTIPFVYALYYTLYKEIIGFEKE